MLFLGVCKVFGTHLPCYTKVKHCWPCARSSPACRGIDGRSLFSGGSAQPLGTYCLETPVAGHRPSGTHLGPSRTCLCPIPATTQRNYSFRTWWLCRLLTIKWRSISYGCSLWVFMAGQTIFFLLLQHLMEVAAIICEGSAIFSKSQNKTQPWWGVLGCFLYINPQLLPFKVSQVFLYLRNGSYCQVTG